MTVFYGPSSASAGASGSVSGSLPPGSSGLITLYNLAGERVLAGHDPVGSGRVVLDVAGYASGVYIVVVEYRYEGALISRGTSKVAILH